jgi:hypothetical protein
MKNALSTWIVVMVMFAGFSFASSTETEKTNLLGMGSFEAGQFESAEKATVTPLSKIWYERVYMQLGLAAQYHERTELHIICEAQSRYSYYQSKDALDNDRPFIFFYPHWAEISYSFGNIEKPWLKIGGGVFPFKYNPDVKDLGEYLFRTGSYPPYMWSNFDFPLARLTGLRASSATSPLSWLLGKSDQPVDSLNLFGIINSEAQFIPLQDFGLSFIGDYTVYHTLSLGAGIYFHHLWSTNEEYTTPKQSNNQYIDSVSGDTTYWTFRATKLMGHASLDPKPLMRLFIPEGVMNLLGKNDLKLYSEVAVLGFKDYPKYYSERWRRIPRMIGLDFPTHQFATYCLLPGIMTYCIAPGKIVNVSGFGAGGLVFGIGLWLLDRYLGTNTRLDVLSGEVEWYYWNYANSYTDYLFQMIVPRPDELLPGYDPAGNTPKWSAYAKKSFNKHFTIVGQVAFDHLRLEQNVYSQQTFYNGEAMNKHGDWSWMLKTQFDY